MEDLMEGEGPTGRFWQGAIPEFGFTILFEPERPSLESVSTP